MKNKRDVGYVKLWRSLQESAIWEKPSLLKVFLYCLFKGSHSFRTLRRIDQDILLKPGEFAESLSQISKSVGFSKSHVHRLLEQLKAEIKVKTVKSEQGTAKYSVISVLNWKKYQCQKADLKRVVPFLRGNNFLYNVVFKNYKELPHTGGPFSAFHTPPTCGGDFVKMWVEKNEADSTRYGTKRVEIEIEKAIARGMAADEIRTRIISGAATGVRPWNLFASARVEAAKVVLYECPQCHRPLKNPVLLYSFLHGSGLSSGCECLHDSVDRIVRQRYACS